jgi:hypothetical protein
MMAYFDDVGTQELGRKFGEDGMPSYSFHVSTQDDPRLAVGHNEGDRDRIMMMVLK